MSLRAVCFDLFHTLVLVPAQPGGSTPEILGIDPAAWTEQVFHRAPHHSLGECSDRVESLRRIAHAIDPGVPESAIRRAVASREVRFRRGLTEVRPPILAALQALRARGLRLGLVSNASHDEIEAWPDSPLAPLFDAVLFSCREKVAKPDPRIFLRAAERLGVAAEECLFVGDGGSGEHSGARGAGMRTVRLLGLLREANPEAAAGRTGEVDAVAETFEELLEVVDRLLLQ